MTNLKGMINEEDCEKMATVASKYGYQVVCDDEEEAKKNVDPNCEKVQVVASKYGYTVNCDEE